MAKQRVVVQEAVTVPNYHHPRGSRGAGPTHSIVPLISSDPDCSNSNMICMKKHPSALDMFNEIVNAAQGKQIVMFLDYDGTLSPVVDDPDKPFMSECMREAVRELAKCFPTATVSGRSRLKVCSFVQLAELYYAGSHGMDIKGPVKGINHPKAKANGIQFQPASKFLPKA